MEHDFGKDPELLDHRLDLRRSELRPLRDRYFPADALVVRGSASGHDLEQGLLEAGFRLSRCEGPGRTRCPILEGKPCPIRDRSDVAIVHIDGRLAWPGSGLLPRLICAANSSSPAVVVLERRGDPPARHQRNVVIGELRPVGELVAATRDLVDGPKTESTTSRKGIHHEDPLRNRWV